MKRMKDVIVRLNEVIGIPTFLEAKHFVGGEYTGRCVDQQVSFIQWLQAENSPVILPHISLIHPNDI